MSDTNVIHNTFTINRTYPVSSERVFAAFADPAKKRRWFAEGENHSVDDFSMDFRVGGLEHTVSHFKEGSPFPGVALINDAVFHDIVLNRRIVQSSHMTLGDHIFSASLVTVEFLAAEGGAELVITHQGAFFENSDGPERRENGWRKIADRLAAELAR
jgi:uncharacterized protein YndB with AHSA1/START domain